MMTMANQEGYFFEVGPIRPPSEGGIRSLLIRATRNCPWNKCTFCNLYKGKKFQIKRVEEIKKEIDSAKAIRDGIKEGMIEINRVPRHCFANVMGWINSGERTAFLQDSNSLIMQTSQLVEVIDYMKETFPSLERITSYARSGTLARKSLEDLEKIRGAGLVRLHVGLESGDNEVLRRVKKGVTADDHIKAGRKAKKAGFELSEYVMPDLGGRSKSEEHARNTAKVLNDIDPDFIRMRPLTLRGGTKIFEEYKKGNFHLSSPHERLKEIGKLVELLRVSGRLCFDHVMNAWLSDTGEPLFNRDYEGYKLPEEMDLVLSLVEEGLEVDESAHVHPKDSYVRFSTF